MVAVEIVAFHHQTFPSPFNKEPDRDSDVDLELAPGLTSAKSSQFTRALELELLTMHYSAYLHTLVSTTREEWALRASRLYL